MSEKTNQTDSGNSLLLVLEHRFSGVKNEIDDGTAKS
jgi:hypothetical protein